METQVREPVSKMVTLWRGLYARVACKVGLDVSYISRVARGKRRSAIVGNELNREFRKTVAKMGYKLR